MCIKEHIPKRPIEGTIMNKLEGATCTPTDDAQAGTDPTQDQHHQYRQRQQRNTRASSSLRVLCLHDNESHAQHLSDRLEALAERLYEKHGIDLVYVNSPLLSPLKGAHDDQENNEQLAKRVWWNQDGDSYSGLDASLMLLRQVWSSMPFWGILAFGKAAGVAAFLPLLPVEPMPSFCVFVQGESILLDDEVLMDTIPCLHLIKDSNATQSELLVKQFGGTIKESNSRFGVQTVNTIGKFMVNQKNELRGEGGTILALQNQIHLVEQEAAMVVAREIAKNPPKALMAVISPHNISGPSVDLRRRPGEEGGGAPCPAEFLLKREKRAGNPTGPSRHHPSAAPSSNEEEEENESESPLNKESSDS